MIFLENDLVGACGLSITIFVGLAIDLQKRDEAAICRPRHRRETTRAWNITLYVRQFARLTTMAGEHVDLSLSIDLSIRQER